MAAICEGFEESKVLKRIQAVSYEALATTVNLQKKLNSGPWHKALEIPCSTEIFTSKP